MYLSKRSKWHIGQRTKENKNGCKILLRNRNIKSIKTLSNSLVSPQIKFFVFFKIIFKGHSEIKIKEVFHWDTSSIAWEVTVITLSVCLSLSLSFIRTSLFYFEIFSEESRPTTLPPSLPFVSDSLWENLVSLFHTRRHQFNSHTSTIVPMCDYGHCVFITSS